MIEQPISTASNLMYLIAGMLIFTKNRFVGILLMILGTFSAWFHMTGDYIPQKLDVAFIFALLLGIIASKYRSIGAPKWIYSLSIIGAPLFFVFHGQYPSFVFIGILFLVSLLFHYLENENADRIFQIFIIFITAFALRQLGVYLGGNIDDILHGLGWHTLTAYGFYLFYKKREKPL